MNRFSNNRIRSLLGIKATYVSSALFLFLLILFLFGVNDISKTSIDKQQQSLETALQRDIVHCYAVEGAYPPSLDYIKTHYGLTYNEDLFFVDYQPVAANILPDVTVIRR